MTHWEYSVEYSGPASMSDAVKIANEQGRDGWELIQIEGNSVRGYELIFKREKQALEEKPEFVFQARGQGRPDAKRR